MTKHWSDCAVNSEPAYPAGECDCGGFKQYQDEGMCQACEFGQCTAKAGCVAISNPQPKQEQGEPVAEYIGNNPDELDLSKRVGLIHRLKFIPLRSKLYTAPQQRTWVGLTDGELPVIKHFGAIVSLEETRRVYQMIDAELRKKNT